MINIHGHTLFLQAGKAIPLTGNLVLTTELKT